MNITVDRFKQAAWNQEFDLMKFYAKAGGDVNICASNGVNAYVTFNIKIAPIW